MVENQNDASGYLWHSNLDFTIDMKENKEKEKFMYVNPSVNFMW